VDTRVKPAHDERRGLRPRMMVVGAGNYYAPAVMPVPVLDTSKLRSDFIAVSWSGRQSNPTFVRLIFTDLTKIQKAAGRKLRRFFVWWWGFFLLPLREKVA
jgi:hypothetical protein